MKAQIPVMLHNILVNYAHVYAVQYIPTNMLTCR